MSSALASRGLAGVAALPRLNALAGPTPLEEARRLSDHLGGPRIFLKRDDLTGVGMGGNKVRKLEYILGRAIAEGADTVIVLGGYQSNLARIASAMGARAGLRIELVLGGVPGEAHEDRGNLLLTRLLGGHVHLVETDPRWEFGDYVEKLADRLRAEGRRPFLMPLGGASPEGMAGYISATAEMIDQFAERDIAPTRLFVAIGSAGTYSGLVLGELNLPVSYKVTGISVSRPVEYLLEKVVPDARAACDALGLANAPEASDLTLFDDYIGQDYGASTEGAREAIELTARLEGVLLDPVYSGKGMHGLIDRIRQGAIGSDETVVFLHTGGAPALFAYDPAVLLPACA